MRFREGDLCTHNRFECKVVSTNEDDKKVCIAYAVFVGDQRIFDENDMKWVPESRVTLVKRDWSGIPLQHLEDSAPITAGTPKNTHDYSCSFTPTFSERRKLRENKENSRERSDRRGRKLSKKKSGIIRKSVISINSVSSTDRSASSSSSEDSLETQPIKTRNGKRREKMKIVESPIPIVPDSFDIHYDEDDGSFSEESDESFSQERQKMVKLASLYESRAEKDRCSILSDEVEFAWDSKRKKVKALSVGSVSSFLVEDTPPIAPPVRRKTLEDLRIEFSTEKITGCSNCTQLLKELWTKIDSIFVLPHQLDLVISLLADITEQVPANVSSEIRMEFTDPKTGFKSVGGWTAGIASVMLLAKKFKKNLFSDFLEKIRRKISDKFLHVKLCYFIALLNVFPVPEDPILSAPTIREMCRAYGNENPEGQALVESCILALLDTEAGWSVISNLSEVIISLAALISSNAPVPADIVVSNCENLGSDFTKKVSKFISEKLPSLSYHTMLVKCGGFLPQTDQGEHRIDFGKYRGASFISIARDRGFCDWTERVSEPSSTAFVDWLDFVVKDRQFAVLGPRTIRADVELIRLSILQQNNEKDSIKKIRNWFLNRACQIQICVAFFNSLMKRFPDPISRDLLSYAYCAYTVFANLADVQKQEFHLPRLNRPRGEIVKEIFRPLIRLGQLVPPAIRLEIGSAIISARALSHEISIEEAREELKNYHAIAF